jgi:hypothetical protein
MPKKRGNLSNINTKRKATKRADKKTPTQAKKEEAPPDPEHVAAPAKRIGSIREFSVAQTATAACTTPIVSAPSAVPSKSALWSAIPPDSTSLIREVSNTAQDQRGAILQAAAAPVSPSASIARDSVSKASSIRSLSAVTPGSSSGRARGRRQGEGQESLAQQAAKLVLEAGSFASPAGRRRTSRAPNRLQLQPTEAPAMRASSDSKYKRQVRSWPSKSNPKPRRHEREAKRYYDGAKELLQTTAAVADELMAAAGDSEHMTNDNCDGSCSPSSAKRRPPLALGDLVQLIGEHMPSSWLSHKRARPEWVSDTTQQRPLPSGMQEKQKGIIEQQATSRQQWQWLAAGFWRLAWLALPCRSSS